MSENATPAKVAIDLRARFQDRNLIDQAAVLVGASRSPFMTSSALKEAKDVLPEPSIIYTDTRAFQKVLDWMDAEATQTEIAGMKRLVQAVSQAE